jgi:hypothetical protein
VLIAGKTPLSDIDYQKSARTTLVGELARSEYPMLPFLSVNFSPILM